MKLAAFTSDSERTEEILVAALNFKRTRTISLDQKNLSVLVPACMATILTNTCTEIIEEYLLKVSDYNIVFVPEERSSL